MDRDQWWGEFQEAFVVAALDCDAVSFDVFDTALLRGFDHPHAVFATVERRALAEGLPAAGFVERRLAAEAVARARHCGSASGREDVAFSHIVDELATWWSRDTASRLAALELDVEQGHVSANPEVRVLVVLARSLGKRVVFTSDMYLSVEQIDGMLRTAGYREHEAALVSSTLGHSKRQLTLFGDVCAYLGVAPSRVLHVGDNEWGDVAAARQAGLKALHYRPPRQTTTRHHSPLLSHHVARWTLDWTPSRRPAPQGDAGTLDRLGFCYGAPLALAFVRWLVRELDEADVPTLYFCSRDGWVLRQVYERVRERDPALPPSTYLMVSRRALCLPALGSLDDEMARYLLGADRDGAVDRSVGESEGRDAAEVWRDLRQHETAILAEASDARARFLRYASTVGLYDHGRAVIVDLGWNATQQIALSEIARLSGKATAVEGRYLGLYATSSRLAHFGLSAGAFLVAPDAGEREQLRLQGAVPLVEAVFAAPHGTVTGYAAGSGGRAVPSCAHTPFEHAQRGAVSRFQSALLRGVEALLEASESPGLGDAREAFECLAIRPDPAAADACGVLRHTDGVRRSTSGAPLADLSGAADLSRDGLLRRYQAAHWTWGFLERLAARLGELRTDTRVVAEELLAARHDTLRSAWDDAIVRMVEAATRDGRREVYVYGAGEFGRRVARRARDAGLRVVSFVDSSRALHGTVVDGLPVVSLEAARQQSAAVFLVGSFAWAPQIEGVIREAYRADGGRTPVYTHHDEELPRGEPPTA